MSCFIENLVHINYWCISCCLHSYWYKQEHCCRQCVSDGSPLRSMVTLRRGVRTCMECTVLTLRATSTVWPPPLTASTTPSPSTAERASAASLVHGVASDSSSPPSYICAHPHTIAIQGLWFFSVGCFQFFIAFIEIHLVILQNYCNNGATTSRSSGWIT